MRLLLFINSLQSGGAERVLAKLADHWVDQGHEVTLATIVPTATDHYAVDPRVQRLSIHSGGKSRHLLHAVQANLQRYRRLRKLVKAVQPDCVVAFMPTANLLAHAACAGRTIPVIMSERTHPPNFPMRAPRPWLRRRLYPKAAGVVVLTEDSAQWCRELGCSNVSVIPNSVALPLPANEPRIHPADVVPEAAELVLSVGRLDQDKQFDHVLQSFAEVRREHGTDSAFLVVIGQGPLQQALQRTAESLGISAFMRFVPAVGNIQEWFQRARVFITASRLEGYPNVLLEALACGCACIAYDCPTGPREIVRNGDNGFLVPLNDQPQLTDRLAQVLRDDDLCRRLSSSAAGIINTHSDAAFFERWDSVVNGAQR